MKTAALPFVLAVLLTGVSFGAQQPGVHKRITNDDIMKMTQAGLSADVINAKIRAANAKNPRSVVLSPVLIPIAASARKVDQE